MDGQYQNKETKLINFLKNWIQDVIENKLWEKYADLHIDEIDSEFKNSDLWIESSLFLFKQYS